MITTTSYLLNPKCNTFQYRISRNKQKPPGEGGFDFLILNYDNNHYYLMNKPLILSIIFPESETGLSTIQGKHPCVGFAEGGFESQFFS